MRRLLVFLVLSVVVVNLYALALSEQEKTPQQTTPQSPQKKTTPGRDKPQTPLKPYTPTEKIKADSAVSFPVDI